MPVLTGLALCCRKNKMEWRKSSYTSAEPSAKSDGQVERMNRSLIDMLAKFGSHQQEDWDTHLPYLFCAYRQRQENFERVRDCLERSAQRQKRNYDKGAVQRHFAVGDWVLRFYPPNLSKSKLNPKYIGPISHADHRESDVLPLDSDGMSNRRRSAACTVR
nr:hypothetical protein BaRGS_005164 [Batillaria attramentaria]